MKRAALLIVPLALYLTTGLAIVGQDEVGVVRRFGAALPTAWEPGLHLGLPWPFDRIDRVKLGQTRTIDVGARGPDAAPLANAPASADDRLTGDLNLVTAQATLQYRIERPTSYLFAAEDIEATLTLATESALTRALAARGVDDVLTTGRAEVAERLRGDVQAEADRLGLGVSIRAVRLGTVAPPIAVAPAFADAARARSDRRQVVTEAEQYRDRLSAEARGQAREIADVASARHERSLLMAKGEADRFAKLLAQVRRDPEAARRRLYLGALAELLPRFARTVVVPAGEQVDLTLVPEASVDAPSPDPSKP